MNKGLLVYCDLFGRRLARSTVGDALPSQSWTAGGRVSYRVRFLEFIDGAFQETDVAMAGWRVSLGARDARPNTGPWRLQVGPGVSTIANTTGVLDWNIPAYALADALNVLTGGTGDYVVDEDAGSYLISRENGGAVTLTARGNRLWPISAVRIGGVQLDGQWVYDVRLTQLPVTFTDEGTQVLPNGPSIETIQEGGSDPSGVYVWSAIQAMKLPPDFRGTYQLRRGFAKTRVLDRMDDEVAVQDALNEILAPEGGSVVVTNPTRGVAHITFGGDLLGAPVEDLEVVIYSAPPGDWSFDLNLDTYEIRALLREVEEVDVPFEAEADFYLDPANPMAGTRTVKLWSESVTLRRPVLWPDLATVQNVDWLRPPSPRSYVPFSMNQVLTGQQQAFATVIGTGAATSFTIDHNLGSELCQIVVRENSAPGRVLRADEYTLTIVDLNQLTIDFGSAPAINALAAYVVSIGPASAFSAHTHTVEDVEGLSIILEDLGSRVQNLETILPSSGPGASVTSQAAMTLQIPEENEVLFSRIALQFDPGGGIVGAPARAPHLLPAVHDATVTTLPNPLPDPLNPASLGQVWENEGSIPVLIPGGGGIRSAYVPPGGFVGCDGRGLFVVAKDAATNTFHPTAFDRTLLAFAINDKMLAVGRTMECVFSVLLHLAGANTKAQWVLQIETGSIDAQSSPSPVGLNLENVTWGAPVVVQPLVVTRMVQSHSFGLRIRRRAAELQMDRQLYGVWSGANAEAPASANFAIRARLTRFDTENVPAPRGWLGYRLVGAVEPQNDGDTKTKPAQVIIR